MTKRMLAGAAVAGFAAIAALFLFLALTNGSRAPLGGFQRSADDRQLIVIALLRPGDAVLSQEAREYDDRVVVIVQVRSRQGTGIDLGVRQQVTIKLREPLGQRTVVDADGRNVPRVALT